MPLVLHWDILLPPKQTQPRVLLGMDTRESSEWIAATLTAGLIAGGASVESAGVITTPAIAFLTHTHGFGAGVVISASHNPWQDNGIKLFGSDGYKLPDATELAIEGEIFRQLAGLTVDPQQRIAPKVNEADRAEYIRFLLAAVPGLSLDGRRIVIDCAQRSCVFGCATNFFLTWVARSSLLTPAPMAAISTRDCGALHPEIVAAQVRHRRASIGITFDGDADRALFADENGCVVNGDAVLLLAGRDLQARGLLTNSTVVATTMSQHGAGSCSEAQRYTDASGCGWRQVRVKQMIATGAALGGEQSGHIIFTGRSTTGDGLLTALLLLDIVHRSGKSLAELVADLKIFPQIIVNVKVREKKPLDSIPTVAAAIRAAEAELVDSGGLLSATAALKRWLAS